MTYRKPELPYLDYQLARLEAECHQSGSGFDRAAAERITRDAARHEAGHATATALLYPPGTLRKMTIEPDTDRWGYVRLERMKLLDPISELRGSVSEIAYTRRILRAFGIHSYAGVAAVHLELVCPATDREQPIDLLEDYEEMLPAIESSLDDRETLAEFARSVGGRRPPSRWHGPSWRRARQLVSANVDLLGALEQRLLEKGTITGSQFDRIRKRWVQHPSHHEETTK